MTEIEKIAAGLTEGQELTLLTGQDESFMGGAGVVLILKGLMTYRRKFWLFGPKVLVPTLCGLRVRAHLKGKRNG